MLHNLDRFDSFQQEGIKITTNYILCLFNSQGFNFIYNKKEKSYEVKSEKISIR